MMLSLFESSTQRRKDASDLRDLHRRYGDEIVGILQARVDDETLRPRDRKHWMRLLRKARAKYPS